MTKKHLFIFLVGIFVTLVAYSASTFTTNYSLEKPADGDTSYGSAIRANFDTVDSQMKTNETSISDHLADTVGAHAATAISASNAGLAVCTTQIEVQDFIACFDNQIDLLAGGGAVDITSAQTISGLKTFSTTPKLSALSNGVLHITSGDGTIASSNVVNADVDAAAAIARRRHRAHEVGIRHGGLCSYK
jgi:hypothetical protein